MGKAAEVLRLSDASGRRAHRRLALRSFVSDEGGATAIEYGMIVGLIAVVIFAALAAMGATSGDSWAASWNKINDAI